MFRCISRDTKYLVLIILIYLAACIETDIYLPAFPDMMDFFETSEEMIQQILTWNFFGICFSCPFYGPLSDVFGRRKLLLGALFLFLLGSVGTIFAMGIKQMLLYRFLQGLGSGGCFTIGSAIIFDLWQGEKAVKVANDLNCAIPIIMAVAPMVGGYLNQVYNFRLNFIVIALFVLISFILCLFFLEETHLLEKRKSFCFRTILNNFAKAMTCWKFLGPTFMICLISAGYLTYVSTISILFMKHMGIGSRIFPLYQATILLSFVVGSLFANRVIDIWGIQMLKMRGLILVYVGGLGFIMSSLFIANSPNLFQLWMIIFSFGCAWVIGPYFTEGMEAFPEIKGVTSSLITSFRLAFTAIVISLTGHFFDGTIYPLVYAIGILLFLGLFVLGFSYREKFLI